MGRSARGSITGLNLQRIDGARLSDLNVRTIVLYDESAAFAPELRQRVPDALIVLRLLQNSHWGDPEGTARAGASLVAAYPMVDIICPANEQNHEHGASSAAIAAWCERFRDEWARQGDPRPLVTPAVSTGAAFNLDDLADAWARFEYIGVHGYTNWDDLTFGAALAHIDAHRRMWPSQPQLLTEFNVDKAEEQPWRWGELASAVDAFLGRLAGLGYVQGAMWFLDDSWNDGEWPYRLCRIPELMDLYRSIGHEQTSGPGPEPPRPPSGDPLVAKYNLAVTTAPGMGVRFEDVTNGTVELEALGPADLTVSLRTADGQHGTSGMGRAAVVMAAESKYFPQNGEHGPWVAACGGARVEGLGMEPDHDHPRTIFERGSTPPPSGYVWDGAFAPHAAQHPEVGRPVGQNVYIPQDTEPWPVCCQLSGSHILLWDGARVVQLARPR